MTIEDRDLFEIIDTTRSMRRLKPDPVPDALVERILAAGTKAPSGQNTQPWAFMVVRDSTAKRWLQERYLAAMRGASERLQKRYLAVMWHAMGDRAASPENHGIGAGTVRAVLHLANHLHEAPVLLLVCGVRDWPISVEDEDRKGLAPPSYSSTFPAVQNILLACRALGLGATLTTAHLMFEAELCERFGIPDTHGVVALIPIGYPLGRFGPVRRRPPREVTHLDHWGRPWPG